MLNSFKYILPDFIDDAVKSEMNDWLRLETVARIWAKDARVWTGDDEAFCATQRRTDISVC